MSSKCNRRMKENIHRRKPAQTLARARVDEINDILQLLISDGEEIAALGEEEAKQAVDILIGAALPRGVRLGKEDRCLESFLNLPEPGELSTVIEGNAVNRDAL